MNWALAVWPRLAPRVCTLPSPTSSACSSIHQLQRASPLYLLCDTVHSPAVPQTSLPCLLVWVDNQMEKAKEGYTLHPVSGWVCSGDKGEKHGTPKEHLCGCCANLDQTTKAQFMPISIAKDPQAHLIVLKHLKVYHTGKNSFLRAMKLYIYKKAAAKLHIKTSKQNKIKTLATIISLIPRIYEYRLSQNQILQFTQNKTNITYVSLTFTSSEKLNRTKF